MLIGNEPRFVEKMLKGLVKCDKNHNELLLLTRYYYLHDGLTREEIKPILDSWYDFRCMGGEYGLQLHKDETVKEALDKYANDKAFLNEVDSIEITKDEWHYIQDIGRNERERKVLFTLLCKYKIVAKLYNVNHNKVKIEHSKLGSMAHTTFTRKNMLDAIKYFEEVGAISFLMGADAKYIRLNYVDNENKPYVVIEDFESLHVYYEYLKSNKSKKIYRCKECGCMALRDKGKQYNGTKYCKPCSEKRIAEQNRNRGKGRDVYKRTIYGVGYLGEYSGHHKREYNLWHSMLQRCYDEEHRDKYMAYTDCTVCERWHCFANFLEDLPKILGYKYWLAHPNEGVSLDKDVLNNSSKVYSLETCCFITKGENSIERNHRDEETHQRILQAVIERENELG